MTRYGGVLKARELVGVRGAGPGVRRALLREERDAQDQARRVQAEFHAHAQRPGLDGTDGEHMRRQRPTSAARAAGLRARATTASTAALSSRTSTRCRSGASWRRCPMCWASSRPAGRCPACRPRAFRRGCFIVPPIGSQVWIEFEQGDPDYPIWTGGFWGLVADVPVLATAPPAIPPGQNIVIQTTGQNIADPQRRAAHAGHRRHHSQERERRHDRRQRDRDLHQQRAGRHDHADRARLWRSTSRRSQSSDLSGQGERECRDPSSTPEPS